MTDSRVRYTSETAVAAIGNRYDLVLVASKRARELRRGHRSKIETTASHTVTALQEIEKGLITRDYLKRGV